MFQANQAAEQFNNMVGTDAGYAGALFGFVLAILVALVIIGGIKRIGKVTEKVVPFMVGIYVLAAIIILVVNLGGHSISFCVYHLRELLVLKESPEVWWAF